MTTYITMSSGAIFHKVFVTEQITLLSLQRIIYAKKLMDYDKNDLKVSFLIVTHFCDHEQEHDNKYKQYNASACVAHVRSTHFRCRLLL